VRRWLCKHGKLRERDHEAPADDPEAAEPMLLQTLGVAAVQGMTAQGPKAGVLRAESETRRHGGGALNGARAPPLAGE
jgi:hypothetical protein